MTFRNPWPGLGAFVLLALSALGGTAHAAGTIAGTDINNAATLNYSVGGITQGTICSSPSGNSTSTCVNTTFKVDNKINLRVTTSDVTPGVSAVPGSDSTLTFTVTNDGNSPQGFSFATIQNLSGSVGSVFNGGTGSVTDTFNPTSCTIYNATNTTAVITSVASVVPDGSVTLKVVCAIPLGRTNVDVAAVALTATAIDPLNGSALTQSTTNLSTAIDIVFADLAGTDDSARDATHSARSAFKISTSDIKVAKTFTTICDPAGGDASGTPAYVPKSIPGSYVQYTVTITNDSSATVAATLSSLADALDVARVTFDAELITGANAGAVPGCAATTAALPNRGTATSSGNSFKVTWAGGARTSFPGGVKYLPAAGNYSSPNINVSWASVLPVEDSYTAAAQLKPGDSVTLTYNVIIK